MALVRVGAVLSQTGRFAPFGRQADAALRIWSDLVGGVAVRVVDDASTIDRVAPAMADLARDCDLLLGPYSTVLARAAVRFCAEHGHLMWNHGGAGDDVQAAPPGAAVSVLSPTSRYAASYVGRVARHHPGRPLRVAQGKGRFAEQVVAGARAECARRGVPDAEPAAPAKDVALLVAGTYEHDVSVLRERPRPPVVGSIAAGVGQVAQDVDDLDGVYGIAQWLPGGHRTGTTGPGEAEFVAAYRRAMGEQPDYPAVQAVAAAAVAAHCRSGVTGSDPEDLWSAATALRTRTLFGDFAIDPTNGAQVGHSMALGRWDAGRFHSLPV